MVEVMDNSIFQNHAEQYENAYNAHLRKYALLNPMPKPPSKKSMITWHHYVVTVILIASAIVSASHTLPVVLGNNELDVISFILAVSTFIMIEITAIYFAYAHITTSHSGDSIPDITTPLKIGVMFTVGAMFAINIYGVLDASHLVQDSAIWQIIAVIIYLWIGCIPPVNAYLCGDVLAINVIQLQLESDVLYDEYLQSKNEWNERFERSWNSKKKDYGVSISVYKQTDSTPLLSEQTDDRQTDRQTESRVSTASDIAYDWLIDNPDKIGLSLRELAELIPNAGKDSINKARKRIESNERS